jgi:hypothetical protein
MRRSRIGGFRPWAALGAAIVLGLFPSWTRAQTRGTDAVYTVANYPVDAIGQDAVTAKEKALADGQQAALRSLLKRLVPVTSYNQLKALRSAKAGELIEGVSVRSERNSTTQYIASLDFAFMPQAVKGLLRREGIPFVDNQASRTVVVPLVRTAQGLEPAGGPNGKLWTEAWSGLDTEHALTPLRLVAPRSLPSPDVVKKLIAGDLAGLQPFATEFRSDQTVVAIAEPDPAARRLHVWLAGTDAAGPILLKRSYRLAGGDVAYTMELAAVVGLGVMEGRWKAQVAPPRPAGAAAQPLDSDPFEITVEFRSRGQWEEMRSRLDRISGVEEVDVVTLTTRSAVLALRFPGGPDRLAGAVGPQGMMLEPSGRGWVLRPQQ